jgi:hypothetical protein
MSLSFAKNWKFFPVPLQNVSSHVEAKQNECVFVFPNTRKLNFDEDFLIFMTELEREAWIALKCVVSTFLGSNRQPDCVTLVTNMLQSLKILGCFLDIKMHFLNSHLHCFSPQSRCSQWAQAERFHQHINETEGRCQVGRMLTWRWLPADGTARSDGMLTSEGERRRFSARSLNKI